MVTTLKRVLFREPHAGNMSGWLWFVMAGIGVVLGCLMIVNGIFFSDFSSIGGPSYSPTLVVLGSMFTFQFAAELLPKNWNFVAGLLRSAALIAAAAGLLTVVLF